ncbi:hypothetical protein KI387_030244, partial [Taxus chinensis]
EEAAAVEMQLLKYYLFLLRDDTLNDSKQYPPSNLMNNIVDFRKLWECGFDAALQLSRT